jgi:excisionase family DNA binding protein
MSESKTAVKPIRGYFLKPDEVAKKLNVCLKTVHNLATSNEIPPHRVRTSLRFDSADVDDYMFFSKFSRRVSNLSISRIEKEEILARFEDQVMQALAYVEKIINESCRKEAPMKK